MRWGLLIFAVFVSCCDCVVGLQVFGQSSDVPEVAAWEIQRRGAHVEMTGQRRGGMMAAAFSPPENDDEKWFVTLIIKSGSIESEKMRSMLASDPEIRAWVDAGDSQRSTTHYQVRNVDDVTQADWLLGLRPAIARSGLPLVVLQPPRSGKFGDAKTIVKLFPGVCSGRELSVKFRDAVIAYVHSLEGAETRLAGVRSDVIGVPPPFNVRPVAPQAPLAPSAPSVPFEFPPAVVPPLSIEQVEAACPGAPADFVYSVVKSRETSPDMVRLLWRVYQNDHPVPVTAPAGVALVPGVVSPSGPDRVELDSANPLKPGPLSPLVGLAFAFGGILLGWIGCRIKALLGGKLADIRETLDLLKNPNRQTIPKPMGIPLSQLMPGKSDERNI